MAIDILNLEFPNVDRDYHAITPLRLYLKKKYKIKIVTKNLYNPYINILKYNPKVILFSNPYGDDYTFKLIRFLKQHGFYIVSLTAEGNTNDERIETYLYGWNTDKVLYQDVAILWTERFRNLLIRSYPELEQKLYVSGSTGFDRYSFLKFKSKEDFLREAGLDDRFSKVITICSSGVFKSLTDPETQELFFNNVFSRETFSVYQKDLPILQELYQKLVRSNPDVLFVLRLHPEFADDIHHSEFKLLTNEPNIYLSTSKGNLPIVSDAISVGDINIGYESTTSLEGWLLNKLSVFVNPTTPNFERESHYQGCLILKDFDSLQKVVNQYYRGEVNEEYEALKPKRDEILRDTIGYADGQNYKRAATIIMQCMPNAKRVSRWKMLRAFTKKEFIMQTLKFYLWQWDTYFKIRRNLKKPVFLYPYEKNKIEKYEKIYENISYE